MKAPHELTALFRARGLKVTPQRYAVFEAMYSGMSHPSAEAVHRAVRTTMPTISLRTVYQTLNDLAEMGEIAQLDLGTGSARYDPNLEPHHHVVCERCGSVGDVQRGVASELTALPAELDGFEVSCTEVIFRGICATCRTGSDIPSVDQDPVPVG